MVAIKELVGFLVQFCVGSAIQPSFFEEFRPLRYSITSVPKAVATVGSLGQRQMA
jgi:hypothetical protein